MLRPGATNFAALRDRRRRAAAGGFSLFELMLVITTIGIVSAIAVPRYAQSLAHYRVRCAAQRISADLTAAAADAVASSTRRTISFDVAANAYSISSLTHLDHRAGTWRVAVDEEPYRSAIVSVDLGGDASIVFDGYGSADSGGEIVVRSGDFVRTIRVDAASGRVTIE